MSGKCAAISAVDRPALCSAYRGKVHEVGVRDDRLVLPSVEEGAAVGEGLQPGHHLERGRSERLSLGVVFFFRWQGRWQAQWTSHVLLKLYNALVGG